MSPEPTKLPGRMVIPSAVAERQELKKLISNAVHSDDVRALQVLELMGFGQGMLGGVSGC